MHNVNILDYKFQNISKKVQFFSILMTITQIYYLVIYISFIFTKI